MSTRLQLIDRFATAFESEAKHRGSREGLEWIELERRVMTLQVLDELRYLGVSPVGVREEVAQAEQSACGHIDYGKKWAIGCADIVMRRLALTQTESVQG